MDWKTKITSRKLWLAVAEFVGMLMVALGVEENVVVQVTALIMSGAGVVAYIIAEGLVDAKAADAPMINLTTNAPDKGVDE